MLTDHSMAKVFLLCAVFLCGWSASGQTTAAPKPAQPAESPAELSMKLLSRPVEDKKDVARKIHMLKLFNGKLYLGHGCYAANTGPTDILFCDPETGKVTKEGMVDDEAITCYRDFDGMLVIPGIDATEDWSFGNCYTLEGGKWIKHRTIPGGLHVFDIVSYRDRWYVGTHGTFLFAWGPKEEVQGQPGIGMVLSSGDKGKTWRFEYSPAIDTNLDSFARNLVVYKDKLYVFYDARTFPNTREFAAVGGKNPKPLDDAFSSLDTLVYDGGLWRAMNLIQEPNVRCIVPIPTGDVLGLFVQFPKASDLYAYDGTSVRKLKHRCDAILDVLPKPDCTYLLIRRGGRSRLVKTTNLDDWNEMLIPAFIGEPLSIECRDNVLFIGTRDGGIWKGTLPAR